ncbi:peroxidase family protein [Kineosporia sp. A_224]|uniref:peroxidase family protein n=1 Tax=Kineosporia sp. A_224 TaxID=1962180 RepID=UPI000B4BC74C|nr:peroxidase family protein [Kineosporia sp. A_224]
MRGTIRATLGAAVCAALVVGAPGAANAVVLNDSDLDFFLRQIQIAEQNAAGTALLGPTMVPDASLPYGLRTVDGRFNNLQPGQSAYGAADRVFPRLTTPVFRTADQPGIFGPPGAPVSTYQQKSGLVVDADPRLVSNAIVDQSTDNAAANAARVRTAGNEPVGSSVSGGINFIPNTAPDEGLSAPYNSWFTLFGQFFDHGLDLVTKGGSGTVIVPLKDDDPLIAGPDGVRGDDPGTATDEAADDLPPERRFMTLTRATNQPGLDGRVGDDPSTPTVDESADDVHEHTNTTTPFVDQNQTYTSHPAHQAFLREHVRRGGQTVATGKFLDSVLNGGNGLATWADVKSQARTLLGVTLTDQDVLNVPKLRTDAYGRLLLAGNGYAQLELSAGGFRDGGPDGAASTSGVVRTNHAFLDDIAHHAAPGTWDDDNNPATPKVPQTPDADPGTEDDNLPGTYDDEMLGAHFITGDGRGNENIGLTAVHHVFHSEHNRLAGAVKTSVVQTALSRGSLAFLNEWLATPVAALPAAEDVDAAAELNAYVAAREWNGERIFQAARFGTEMQYQHLVFEEFARKLQPEVNIFTGYETNIDPAITAEFAHTVYRFGHSMLTETVDREAADGSDNSMGLIEAFLNPQAFTQDGAQGITPDEGAGQVVRGMTAQVGSELDEFVTDAVRDNLLGLPLDLAALNLARGRDTGIPPLNAARADFFAATNHPALRPYDSWEELGLELRNPESLVNFVAAYGVHPALTDAGADGALVDDGLTTTDESADNADTLAGKKAAALLLVEGGPGAPADRADFLGATGAYASAGTGPSTPTDTGRGGLNDVDFWIGGLAERPMPFGGMLGSSFNFVFETQMEALQDGDRLYYLSRNVGLNFLTELESNSFAEIILKNTDIGLPTSETHLPHDVFSTPNHVIEIDNGNGSVIDDPDTTVVEASLVTRLSNGTVRFTGGEHIVMGGSPNNDRLTAGDGDDSLWGDGGNDRLEGGAGNDFVLGGDGDDIMTDTFGIDVLKGGAGDDAINGGPGTGDLILAGSGKDFVNAGVDIKETFADDGDDFVKGGDSESTVFGDEGSDWIEGGAGADLLQGGLGGRELNSDLRGHDVIIGDAGNDDYDAEAGDDIMVTGPGIERNEGVFGFDWTTYERDPQAANADLAITGIPLPPDLDNIRDRFDLVEGLSGGPRDDILRGDDRTAADLAAAVGDPATDNHELTAEGIARIEGLDTVLGGATTFDGGNIILGGAGSDTLEGRGGDDLIDGDAMLEVGIRNGSTTVESMGAVEAAVFAGTLDPGTLEIRRYITTAPVEGDSDTAFFAGPRANYTVDVLGDGNARITDTVGTDGVDTLQNIEFVQFADATVQIGGPIPPQPATGTVDVTGTLAEDQTLTAVRAFDDPNGVNVASISYTWFAAPAAAGPFGQVGTGTTLPLSDAVAGQFVKVVANFLDNLGTPESRESAVVGPVVAVNDAPTGTVTLDDTTPLQGSLITSTNDVADADGLGTLQFQWLRGGGAGTVIAGATGATYTPVAADVNQTLRLRISWTDGQGFTNAVTSAATAGTGANFVGTAGANAFNGTGNADVADGLGGNDTLNMGGGADTVTGGPGNDTITAGAGDDTILVAPGDGFDNVNGGAGTDVVRATAGGTVIGLSALAGVEQISGGTFAGVSIGLGPNGGVQSVSFGGVTLDGIEFIDAGGGNDNVTGSAAADDIRGAAGNDTLNGGDGADRITGGTGNDAMNGGADNDVFVFLSAAAGGGVFGTDTITGFDQNPTDGQDLLDLSSLGVTAGNFAARVAITQVGANVRVRVDGSATQTVTLNGETLAQITIQDFVLAP